MEAFKITYIPALVALFTSICAILSFFFFSYLGVKSKRARRAEEVSAFDKIVGNLSSSDNTVRLASAIMIRRFFNGKVQKFNLFLFQESANVISSMLKVLPTGIFQKTMADGLAYAVDLSNMDLQKTNLQDVYLGRKDDKNIKVDSTDFYLADLSYALLENLSGKAIFYRSILFCTQIKNSDLSNSCFREADLTRVKFKNVFLKNADFTGALHVPDKIKEKLVDGKYLDDDRVTAGHKLESSKSIFFSMPSIMEKGEELLTKDFKSFLEAQGYNVHYYIKDDYPCYGQLNRIREKIKNSVGMVAFGFKQISIKEATFRPNTNDEQIWQNKWMSTPWNDIEVGMALMEGMPVLIIKNPMVDMGVFDDKLSECFIASISTTDDNRKLSFNKEVQRWLSKLSV